MWFKSQQFMLTLVALLALQPLAVSAVNLDVLVLYNNTVESYHANPRSLIQSHVNYANSVYGNSNMDLTITAVQIQRLDLTNGAQVSQALLDEMATSAAVLDLRDIYRPDIVVYYTSASSSACGRGNFPQPKNPMGRGGASTSAVSSGADAVAAVGHLCPNEVLAHEIGHVLGAGHGKVGYHDDDVHPGYPFEWSKGFGARGVFRTVMAYLDYYNAPRQAYISNPNVLFNGYPTGSGGSFAARGMMLLADDVVKYNSLCYPTETSTVRNRDGSTKTVRSCGPAERYCLRYETQTVQQGRKRVQKQVCVEYDPD